MHMKTTAANTGGTIVAACAIAFVWGHALPALAQADGGADGGSRRPAAIAATGIAPGVVDGEAARKLVAAGIKVVDVRTPAEFDAGHVPGAVNIPYDEMPQRHGELGPSSTPVLVYCKSGQRSSRAIATLRERGFTQIFDLLAYDRWLAAAAAR
jgi:phage shock protein E